MSISSQPVNTSLPAPISSATRNRLLAILFTSVSIFNASQVLAFTLYSIVGLYLTNNEALSGIPTTLVLTGRALIAYPIGWLMEKLGRRNGIAVGFLFSIIGTGFCAWAINSGSFFWFCVGCFLNGMGRGVGEQARYAAADLVAPERAANAIGLIVWAGTIGAVIGPWLLASSKGWATTIGLVDFAGPYLWTSALSLISLLILVLFLYPDPKLVSEQWAAARQSSAKKESGPARTQSEVFKDPQVRLAIWTLGASQLAMTIIMVVNPLHMHHMHYGDADLSLVSMAHTLGMFALAWLTSWLVGRLGKLPVIFLGAGVLIISAIMAPLAQSAWMLALALFLLGYGWNLGFVAGSALLSSVLAPGERPRTQGISETMVAVAAALGSFSTGPLFGWGGVVIVGVIGLIFALSQMAAVLWAMRRQQTMVVAAGD